MRCEECLAVVEEYFDGELVRHKAEQVAAHLAACADCAAAHDALAFEQELFLRYDRGLEVSPALWQNVRAAVARLEESERPTEPLPPFAALRRRLAGAFGALAPRAAFAPALALFLLAALAGALWLARRPGATDEVASAPPSMERAAAADPQPGASPEPGAPPAAAVDNNVASVAPVVPQPSAAERGRAGFVNAGAADVNRPARGALTPPPDPDHLEVAEAELAGLAAPAVTAESADVVLASAHLPTPEEKEMARHLEQAQMLLRSFQNEVAEGGDAVQIAYERRLSRRLLEESAALRVEADAVGDKQTRRVLDALEPFLLDIANLRDDASRDEVRSIKERMQKKEIVAALHVY